MDFILGIPEENLSWLGQLNAIIHEIYKFVFRHDMNDVFFEMLFGYSFVVCMIVFFYKVFEENKDPIPRQEISACEKRVTDSGAAIRMFIRAMRAIKEYRNGDVIRLYKPTPIKPIEFDEPKDEPQEEPNDKPNYPDENLDDQTFPQDEILNNVDYEIQIPKLDLEINPGTPPRSSRKQKTVEEKNDNDFQNAEQPRNDSSRPKLDLEINPGTPRSSRKPNTIDEKADNNFQNAEQPRNDSSRPKLDLEINPGTPRSSRTPKKVVEKVGKNIQNAEQPRYDSSRSTKKTGSNNVKQTRTGKHDTPRPIFRTRV